MRSYEALTIWQTSDSYDSGPSDLDPAYGSLDDGSHTENPNPPPRRLASRPARRNQQKTKSSHSGTGAPPPSAGPLASSVTSVTLAPAPPAAVGCLLLDLEREQLGRRAELGPWDRELDL
jgi:hypothetical protein